MRSRTTRDLVLKWDRHKLSLNWVVSHFNAPLRLIGGPGAATPLTGIEQIWCRWQVAVPLAHDRTLAGGRTATRRPHRYRADVPLPGGRTATGRRMYRYPADVPLLTGLKHTASGQPYY